MLLTDIIFLIFLGACAGLGAWRGFLRALIGPAAFLIACALSGAYSALTHKIFESLLVLLLGPPIIGWGLKALVRRKDQDQPLPPLACVNRVFGAIIGLTWGGVMGLVLIAIVVILPLDSFGLGDITRDVHASATLALFRHPLEAWRLIPPDEINACLDGLCGMPKKTQTSLTEDQDIQELAQDPRLQKLLLDPVVQKAITDKDFPALLSNPQILDIVRDPALVAKMLKVFPKIRAAQQAASTSSSL